MATNRYDFNRESENDEPSIVTNPSIKSSRSTTSKASSTSTNTSTTLVNSLNAPPTSEQISNYLELEENEKKDQIIADLLCNGRRALSKYEEDIFPDIYKQEMNSITEEDDNRSTLLKLIKQQLATEWETLLIDQPVLLSFINKVKEENDAHYDMVLTRIAQNGIPYSEQSAKRLFVVIQMLFQGIDEETYTTTNTLSLLWISITTEGIESIKKFSNFILSEDITHSINTPNSPLFLALRMYYSEQVKKLFTQFKVQNRKGVLYDEATEIVTKQGWVVGLKSIEDRFIPRTYELVMAHIQENYIPQPPETSVRSEKQNAGSAGSDSGQGGSSSRTTVSKHLRNCTLSPASSKSGHYHRSPSPALSLTGSAAELDDDTFEAKNLQRQKQSSSSPRQSTTNSEGGNIEKNLVRKCIPFKPLLLENLVEAGELKYVNKTFSDISNELVHHLTSKQLDLPEFIQECLTPLMFFLKRQQNLDNFMSELSFAFENAKDDFAETTFSLNLRTFSHILLLSSDIFLRRIIMSLISKRNAVPFVQPALESSRTSSSNEKYDFISSIIHVWDHTRPTLLSFGIGSDCKGKSSLLNALFQCTFESNDKSVYFNQTIDIDFGYSFIPERPVNVADCHGEMSLDLLSKIDSLFDGYLVHITVNYLGQYSHELIDYLESLPRRKSFFLLIRDVPVTMKADVEQSKCQKILDSSNKLRETHKSMIFPLMDMTNTNDKQVQHSIKKLRDSLLPLIKQQPRTANSVEQFEYDLEALLDREYVAYLKSTNDIIKPLKNRLSDQNPRVAQNNFPLYLKFVQLCKLRQSLMKIDFYGTESDAIFKKNQEVYTLENELDPTSTSAHPTVGDVFESFIKILRSDNMLMSLSLLSSELKEALHSLGSDKIAGTLEVATSFLSLEVLWRNAIVCYEHSLPETQNLIVGAYVQYVSAGFPFELIDGDQFYFQHDFLSKVMQHFARQRILVISIIGPQNSGKSTLLNYMFGTLFEVREGRCTRGIYGSFVRCSGIEGIDYIMLIDTEGLLSIEKRDPEYDRRIVLFCLAVSHLVVVNMQGDLQTTLKDLLTLCTDSLKQMGVNRVPKPTVHFVLNQRADPNLKNQMEAIKSIIADLKEKDLGETIDISTDTFHALPSAFKKDHLSNDSKSPGFLRTEPVFIEQTQKLVAKITQSAKIVFDRADNANCTPPQWLSTSITIFDILQRFPDLTYFKDINERRQDDRIRKQIGELLSNTLSPTYRQSMIEQCIDMSEEEIKQLFQAELPKHQRNLKEELDNIIKLEKAADRIRDRSQLFLDGQVIEILTAWCTAAIQSSDKKQMELLVRDGQADLTKLIDAIIREGRALTREQATAQFEQMWQKKVELLKVNFNVEDRLKKAIQFCYKNYNIFEKRLLPNIENIANKLPILNHLILLESYDDLKVKMKEIFNSEVKHLRQNAVERLASPIVLSTTFSKATIESFIYLNKQILLDQLVGSASAMDIDPVPISPGNRHRGNMFQRAGRFVTDVFTGGSSSSSRPAALIAVQPKPLAFDFRKNVRDFISEELHRDTTCPSNIVQVLLLFDKISEQVWNLVSGSGIVRPVEIDLIQKVVGTINQSVLEMNRELSVFDLSLSRNVTAALHSNVLLLLIVHYFGEQQQHFHEQIATLHVEKPSLLTYFISMVVPDASCDKEGGEIFVNQLLNTAIRTLSTAAHNVITTTLQTQQNLNRKEIQQLCDGKLQTADDEWLMNYIQEPTDIIVEEFKAQWTNIEERIEQQLRSEKDKLKPIFQNFFHLIKTMNSSLIGEGPAAKFIDELFSSSGGMVAENLKNKGQSTILLLCAYLKNQPIQLNMSFKAQNNNNYTVTVKGIRFFQKLTQAEPTLAQFIDSMTTNTEQTSTPITPIRNFQVFLESIIAKESEVMAQFDVLPATFADYDKDNWYIKLLDKARGCTATCPCCIRPCDADHSSVKSNPGDENNKHCCSTGHQLRAFAGIKFEITNEASLYQCTEIEDHSFIVVKGIRKKWAEMKKDYQQWDFNLLTTADESSRLKGKFLYVWSKVGQIFCERHEMLFVHNNTPRSPPAFYHYILLLDSSGSMQQDDRWANLMAGVNTLVRARASVGPSDRITIIPFTSRAKLFCSNEIMTNVDTTKIRQPEGGTDFGPALDLVIKTIAANTPLTSTTTAGTSSLTQATATTKLPFIIVLMSDGEAPYPESQLTRLVTMKEQIAEFWTVALGNGQMPILEQINATMNGIYKQMEDSNDLVEVYAEIAQEFSYQSIRQTE